MRVADLALRVTSEDADLELTLDDEAQRFRDTSPSTDVDLAARWGDLRDARPVSRAVFDSGGVWSLYDSVDALFFLCASPRLAPHPYKSLRLERSLRRGEIVFDRHALGMRSPIAPLEYPLDELLMTHLLAAGRGVELHGAGIAAGRAGGAGGMLFLGASGAGKSTMTRLWQRRGDARVLSDDRIIVRAGGDGSYTMHGTPWHGEAHVSLAEASKLDVIFLIRHATKNAVRPVRGARAAARLFACAFPPLYSAAALGFTLELLGGIARAVPIFELDVVPDEAVIAFIEAIT